MGSLFENFEKIGNKIALIDEDKKKYTYKQVSFLAKRITSKIENNSLLIIIADNSLPSLIGYISFIRSEHTIILLDQNFDFKFINQTIKKFKPNYIYARRSFLKQLSKVKLLFNYQGFCLFKTNNKNHKKLNNLNKLILTTSGSTQSPKFVRLSNKNLLSNTKNIIEYLKINSSHTTITTMPMAYSYGLSIINTHLFSGASIVTTNMSIVEKSFWKLMKNQKVTSFGGVPYFYEILKKINFHKIFLTDLKYFTQAGGALNKDLTKYFLDYAEKNKLKFFIMYGQTEATSRMTYLPHKSVKKKIGSIGIPISGGRIILRNNNKQNNKSGEIIYSGKNVSMGYAKNCEDLIRADENKGILATGDLATKDNDGYLYITGRKSREVKLYGHRVNLDELENILMNKGYKCICHGFDDQVVIFHTNKNYKKKVLKILSYITKLNIDCFKLKLLKKFPLNESGKVLYRSLEKFI